MPLTIRLAGALRSVAEGGDAVIVDAATVEEALQAVATRCPALRTQLFDRKGLVRSELRVYVNDDNIRLRQGLETPLAEGDQVVLIPPQPAG